MRTRKPASWIIRDKRTKKVVMETFNEKLVARLNTATYDAVPIGDHLEEFNRLAKEAAALESAKRD